MKPDETLFRNKLPRELEEVNAVLTAANEASGSGLLTPWEENFAYSSQRSLQKHGAAWDLTPARKQALEKIESKLERAGLT